MPACRRHGRLPLESRILLRAIGLANSLADLDPSTELLAHPRHEAVLVDGREIFSLASNSAKRTVAQRLNHPRHPVTPSPRRHLRLSTSAGLLRQNQFVETGGDRGVLRQNLGHASDATTAIYDRSGARHRRREVEKVFG